MSELPKGLKREIYTQFLFKDFIYLFKNYFVFDDNQNGKKINSFKKQSDIEVAFICGFLEKLEPRYYDTGDIILSELEDVEEIFFVVEGEYGIGYDFNKQMCFGKRMGRKTVIADYYLLFKKKSEFIFRCFKPIHAFTIKRMHMFDILEKTKKYGEIIKQFKAVTYERYKRIIREPMIMHKQKTFITFSKRCDYEQNLVL